MDDLQGSETQAQPQEQRVEPQVSLQPSEGAPAAQDTATPLGAEPAPPSPVQIDAEEQAKRERQSELDKREHRAYLRARKELETQYAQQAQQKAMEGMSDADLGQFIRKNQRVQQEFADRFRDWNITLAEQAMSRVSDDKVREEILQRNADGEFKSFEEFIGAIVDAEVSARTKKTETRLERTITQAVSKDLAAEQTGGGQEVGSGAPLGDLGWDSLSDGQQWGAAVAEAFKEKK